MLTKLPTGVSRPNTWFHTASPSTCENHWYSSVPAVERYQTAGYVLPLSKHHITCTRTYFQQCLQEVCTVCILGQLITDLNTPLGKLENSTPYFSVQVWLYRTTCLSYLDISFKFTDYKHSTYIITIYSRTKLLLWLESLQCHAYTYMLYVLYTLQVPRNSVES